MYSSLKCSASTRSKSHGSCCFVWLSDKLCMLSDHKPSITCRICSVGITEETYAAVDVIQQTNWHYVCPSDPGDAVEGSVSSQWVWPTGAVSTEQRPRRRFRKLDEVCAGQGELSLIKSNVGESCDITAHC